MGSTSDHSTRYPNSGSVEVALERYHELLCKTEELDRPLPLISIVVDIAYRNPRTYPIVSAILSKILSVIGGLEKKEEIIQQIKDKFRKVPNTGQLDIWLQRICYPIAPHTVFDEPLCQLVNDQDLKIWNSDWISSPSLCEVIIDHKIIDKDELSNMGPVVSSDEVALFVTIYN